MHSNAFAAAAAAAAAEAIALHYGLMHMIIPNSEEKMMAKMFQVW